MAESLRREASERQGEMMESSMKGEVEHVGPYERYDVLLDGRRVPFRESQPMNGGMVQLLVDGRSALTCSVADAESVVPFVADAIAVALGYTMHPRADMAEPFARPPFVRVHNVILEANPEA